MGLASKGYQEKKAPSSRRGFIVVAVEEGPEKPVLRVAVPKRGMIMARRRSGKKIDFTRWQFASQASSTSAGTVGITAISSGSLTETLMRTRGSLVAFLDAISAPDIGINVSMGLILVPEGTGTTVLWSPLTDGNAPWLWFTSFHLFYEEKVTDVISIDGPAYHKEVIDVKAMRIVRPDHELQLVVENTTVASAGTVRFGATQRFLLGS